MALANIVPKPYCCRDLELYYCSMPICFAKQLPGTLACRLLPKDNAPTKRHAPRMTAHKTFIFVSPFPCPLAFAARGHGFQCSLLLGKLGVHVAQAYTHELLQMGLCPRQARPFALRHTLHKRVSMWAALVLGVGV